MEKIHNHQDMMGSQINRMIKKLYAESKGVL